MIFVNRSIRPTQLIQDRVSASYARFLKGYDAGRAKAGEPRITIGGFDRPIASTRGAFKHLKSDFPVYQKPLRDPANDWRPIFTRETCTYPQERTPLPLQR